jgi:glucosamine--fructose-6-phosphate aminotransferase (isomerizing)
MAAGEQVAALIRSQAGAWAEALRQVAPLSRGVRYLLVGSGSSFYVATAAAAVARRCGLEVEAAPAADLCLEPDVTVARSDAVVVISRSGTTSEAVWAADNAKRRGRRVIALTADPSSALAERADMTAGSPHWDDATVVMIKSFTAMLTYLEGAVAASRQPGGIDELNALPAGFASAYQAGETLVDALGANVPRRIVLLGGGVRWGVALEGMLKVTEMAHVPTVAYHPLEFRHGPRGALAPDDWIVLLGQVAHARHEAAVLADMAAQTRHLAVVAAPGWFEAETVPVARCLLPEDPPDLWTGPLALVPLQMLAWHVALQTGEDPDHPAHLGKVVRIDRQ